MAAAIASLMLNKDKVGIYEKYFFINRYFLTYFVNLVITLYLLLSRPMHDSLYMDVGIIIPSASKMIFRSFAKI